MNSLIPGLVHEPRNEAKARGERYVVGWHWIEHFLSLFVQSKREMIHLNQNFLTAKLNSCLMLSP